MKKIYTFLTAGLVLLLCTACPGPSKTVSYKVNVTPIATSNAPALQSFAHATSGEDWLLFAGRTNKDALLGGIHNLNANYADSSFIPKSFNTKIHTYNPTDDVASSIEYTVFINGLKNHLSKDTTSTMYTSFKKLEKDSTNFTSIFVNSNPLVTQDDGYLYLIGGYGPKNFEYFEETPNWHQDTTATDQKKQEYITYDQVVRLHIASLIKLTKKQTLSDAEWSNIFRYDTATSLVSTGAEVLKIGDNFYVAGGHDFTSNSQKYLDAVYPFSVNPSTTTVSLGVSVSTAISDVSDPTDPDSDNLSIFRRRDGPVVPSMYYNETYKRMEQSITFYGGVFKPGSDNDLQAWNDAIYVHPDWATGNKLYTYDTTYNQDNFNVYACGNFVGLDNDSNLLHTFLLGGIGDGKPSSALSGFSNTGLHITMDVKKQPMQSKIADTLHNVFGKTSYFYGAESILIKSEGNVLSQAPQQVNGKTVLENTEIIDLKATFNTSNEVVIGHIYGGIEAFESNPGTYGKGKSAASSIVWQVTLTKEEK